MISFLEVGLPLRGGQAASAAVEMAAIGAATGQRQARSISAGTDLAIVLQASSAANPAEFRKSTMGGATAPLSFFDGAMTIWFPVQMGVVVEGVFAVQVGHGRDRRTFDG